MTAQAWLGKRIDPDDHVRWRRLGFDDDSVTGVSAVAAAVLVSEAWANHVRAAAEQVAARIGVFTPNPNEVFGDADAESCSTVIDGRTVNVPGGLAIVALLALVDDVRAQHRSRGVSDEQSWRSLSDLGQQVWVHRQTFGNFGLHTHGWLTTAWSGALHWLGRLQFNLHWYAPASAASRWVLSTHIPQSGSLRPDAVQSSLDEARQFFALHYPDYPVSDFHCSSWLLDPRLQQLSGSNLADFQARWQLTGEAHDGNADALFFVFHRRDKVDLAELPRNTGLQRLVLDTLTAGQRWQVATGVVPAR